MRVSPRQNLIGKVVARRYLVKRLIGVGGMGAIYEVEHQRIGRPFALKTLSPDLIDDEEALARFRREADIIARLRHPNIVEIVDWETMEDGSPCMVMELLHGEDLGELMDRSVYLPWSTIAQVGDEILAALATAHEAGVIHRDLKPNNIFLADDGTGKTRAKLLDFGVSKIRHATTMVTADSRILGTPGYMSPEQADGKHDTIGPATDTWAMGAILHEMATGRPAFDADSIPSILYRICFQDPDPIRPLRPDASDEFIDVVLRALCRDPAKRLTDPVIMRAALADALNSTSHSVGDVTRVDAVTAVDTPAAPDTGVDTTPAPQIVPPVAPQAATIYGSGPVPAPGPVSPSGPIPAPAPVSPSGPIPAPGPVLPSGAVPVAGPPRRPAPDTLDDTTEATGILPPRAVELIKARRPLLIGAAVGVVVVMVALSMVFSTGDKASAAAEVTFDAEPIPAATLATTPDAGSPAEPTKDRAAIPDPDREQTQERERIQNREPAQNREPIHNRERRRVEERRQRDMERRQRLRERRRQRQRQREKERRQQSLGDSTANPFGN